MQRKPKDTARFLLAIGLTTIVGAALAASATDRAESLFAELELAPAPVNSDQFVGFSVAIEGDTAVVGGPHEQSGFGRAYVFERDFGGPDSWGQVAVLEDGLSITEFGHAVALEGDLLAVGVPESRRDGLAFGAVTVYRRNPRDGEQWLHETTIYAADAVQSDRFGATVAFTGNTMVVGAPSRGGGFGPPGAAFVFELDPDTRTWHQVTELEPRGDAPPFYGFGDRVAIDGDTIAVAASDAQSRISIYERNLGGPSMWGLRTRVESPGGASFGWNLDLQGDEMAAATSERIYLLERNRGGPDAWGVAAELSPAKRYDEVLLSGDTIYATAPDEEVDVFRRDPDWRIVGSIRASGAQPDSSFGEALAFSDGILIAGAPYQRAHKGAAFVLWDLPCDLSLATESTRVEVGSVLAFSLRLLHRRLATAVVPLEIWIETADGRVVARRATPPQTFDHGDLLERHFRWPLPNDLEPGDYELVAGIAQMQQGVAHARQPFTVIDPGRN